MYKDPLSYEFLTYCWVIVLAAWGGLASYVRKLRQGYIRFSLAELIGEICVSAFVGIITFFMCESSEFNQIFSAALIGITGHMGSRAIFIFEKIVEPLFTKISGKANDNAH